MNRPRRGDSGLSGILLIDKSSGMTSHDVVASVRRATGEARVGHAGTLDPAATGVLVVLVGPATRLAPFLTAHRKGYEATIIFGTSTDTDDAEGAVTGTAAVSYEMSDPSKARAALSDLIGPAEQLPPAYSAIKKEGRVAHRAARQGEPLTLEPRSIEVHSAGLVAIDEGPPLSWSVRLTVSKGTYVRAIARDLGTSLGTLAHLGALRRTSSGLASLDDARSLDEIEAASDPRTLFADPVELLGFPLLEIGPGEAERVSNGSPLEPPQDLSEMPPETLYSIVHGSQLLAIYGPDASKLRLVPRVVLSGGVSR